MGALWRVGTFPGPAPMSPRPGHLLPLATRQRSEDLVPLSPRECFESYRNNLQGTRVRRRCSTQRVRWEPDAELLVLQLDQC